MLRVVDLKAGVHQLEMTISQRRQLLLYAHLVFVNLGQEPDLLVIQDARGKEYLTDSPSSEVAASVDQATSTIGEFNSMVLDQRLLARPGAEQCTYCEFRAVCPDYWRIRQDDWHPLDALGVVTDIDHDVATIKPTSQGSSTTRMILCHGASVTQGDEIAALDLEPAGPASGRMRWDSRLRMASA